MFGLLKTKPPLTTGSRTNIELMMRNCVDILGHDLVRDVEVIGELKQLLEDESLSLYESISIGIRKHCFLDQIQSRHCLSQELFQEDPLRAVSNYLRLLSFEFLQSLGEGYSGDDALMSDLLPVCMGFGIILSDACFYSNTWNDGSHEFSEMSSLGYLNGLELGYAIALFAIHRNEPRPSWSKWLRPDSRKTMDQSLKYFRQIAKSDIQPLFATKLIPNSEMSQFELSKFLYSSEMTFVLTAMLELEKHSALDREVEEGLIHATKSKDFNLVTRAIKILAFVQEPSEKTVQRIWHLIDHANPNIAFSAVRTAHEFGLDLTQHDILIRLLRDFKTEPYSILRFVQSQGLKAENCQRVVCELLVESLSPRGGPTRQIVDCLRAVSEQPEQTVMELLPDGAIRHAALSWISGETTDNFERFV